MLLKVCAQRYLLKNTTVVHVVVKQLLMIVMTKGNVSFPGNANAFVRILWLNFRASSRNIIGMRHLALAFACLDHSGELAILDMLSIPVLRRVLVSPYLRQLHLY